MGSLALRLGSLAGPIIHTMQCQWLTLLSLADDQILSVEDMIEALFPPSTHVFDMISFLAAVVSEILPTKFDTVVDQFPTVIRRIPALNWALAHFFSTLNFFVVILLDWAYDGAREVREITVHVNCDESTDSMALGKHPNNPKGGPDFKGPRPINNSPDSIASECDISKMVGNNDEDGDLTTNEEIIGVSKDVSGEEEDEKRGLRVTEGAQTQSKGENDENSEVEEPIFELFDVGWHMR